MPKDIRQIRIEGNIAFVPLTRGYEAIIDASLASVVGQWNWYAVRNKRNIYAARHNSSREKMILMHRFLKEAEDGSVVDHIDGSGLNNTLRNLRIVTHQQNCWNSRKTDRKGLFLAGVTARNNGMWRARITIKGKRVHLGDFPTENMAAEAYKVACKMVHGEYYSYR